MELKAIPEIKTKEEAQQTAIDFQSWVSQQNLSYLEISNFQSYFETLAKKFNLMEEFKENGIISLIFFRLRERLRSRDRECFFNLYTPLNHLVGRVL